MKLWETILRHMFSFRCICVTWAVSNREAGEPAHTMEITLSSHVRYSYARRLRLEMCSLYSTIHSRVFGSWSSFPGTVMSSEVCRNNAPAVAFPTRTAINDFLLFLFFSLGVYLSRAWMGEKLISISENFASLALQSAFSFFFFFFVVVAVIRYRLKDCEHVNA